MNNSALEILVNTISEYNENTSDLNKFAFSAREKEIFVSMMKRYAFECSKASLEKASEGPSFYKVNSKCARIYGLNKDTITDKQNIVLL